MGHLPVLFDNEHRHVALFLRHVGLGRQLHPATALLGRLFTVLVPGQPVISEHAPAIVVFAVAAGQSKRVSVSVCAKVIVAGAFFVLPA